MRWYHGVNSIQGIDLALRDGVSLALLRRLTLLRKGPTLATTNPDEEKQHAVRGNVQLLEKQRDKVLIGLEVDVGWNTKCEQPVIRHAKTSDLPQYHECVASSWINALFRNKRFLGVGVVKFDFKNFKAVRPVLEAWKDAMNKYFSHANAAKAENSSIGDGLWVKVWVNGDVVIGPGGEDNCPSGEEIKELFAAWESTMPSASLSLGWTTSWPSPWESVWSEPERYAYQAHQIDEMLALCNSYDVFETCKRHNSIITFAVRASLCQNSWKDLKRLVKSCEDKYERGKISLTLWTGWEGVPQSELDCMKKQSDLKCEFDCEKGSKREWYSMQRYCETFMAHYL